MNDPSDKETLGERIRRLRKERGFPSQGKFAQEIGITNGWLSQIERDQEMPSGVLLNKIALTLKVPMRELLQDKEEQMELESRIKLIEVLLETNQAGQAEEILHGLQEHPDLEEGYEVRLAVLQAECWYQQKRYDEMLELLLPLIERLEAKNYPDIPSLAAIRNNIGKAHFEKRDFTNAYYNFRKAYDYSLSFVAFDSLAARISYNVGITLRRLGKSQDSIYYLERAHGFFHYHKDLKRMADTIFDQGICYKNTKKFERASECFDTAKALYNSLNHKLLSMVVQHTVAYELTALTDPQLAIQQLHECAQVLKEQGEWNRVILLYGNIGQLFLRSNMYREARVALNQALELSEIHSTPSSLEVGLIYRAMASYYFDLDDSKKSVEYALKSSEIFDRIGLTRDQIECLRIASQAFKKIDNVKQALLLSEKCDQLWQKLSEERS